VGIRLSRAPHPLDVAGLMKAEGSLHARLPGSEGWR
jgi:hypothetical protein